MSLSATFQICAESIPANCEPPHDSDHCPCHDSHRHPRDNLNHDLHQDQHHFPHQDQNRDSKHDHYQEERVPGRTKSHVAIQRTIKVTIHIMMCSAIRVTTRQDQNAIHTTITIKTPKPTSTPKASSGLTTRRPTRLATGPAPESAPRRR